MKIKNSFRYPIILTILILAGLIVYFIYSIYSIFFIPKPILEKLNINSSNITTIEIQPNLYGGREIISNQKDIDDIINWLNSVNMESCKKINNYGSNNPHMFFFYNNHEIIDSFSIVDEKYVSSKYSDYKTVGEEFSLNFLDKYLS